MVLGTPQGNEASAGPYSPCRRDVVLGGSENPVPGGEAEVLRHGGSAQPSSERPPRSSATGKSKQRGLRVVQPRG